VNKFIAENIFILVFFLLLFVMRFHVLKQSAAEEDIRASDKTMKHIVQRKRRIGNLNS